METLEIFETSVDIADPIGFHTNPGLLLARLEHDYVGKCKNGYLILAVDKILKMSTCMLNMFDPRGGGYISVVLRVRALRYVVGDIVSGCTLKRAINGSTLGIKGPLCIIIKPGPYNSSLAEESMIIVKITSTYYSPGLQIISAEGEIYTFSAVSPIYSINAAEVNREIVDPLLDKAREEFENVKNSEWRRVFSQAWKEPQQLPDGSQEISLFEIPTTGTIIVSRDSRIDATAGTLLMHDTLPSGATLQSCESATMSMCNLIWSIRNIFAAVKDLGEEYEKSSNKQLFRTALTILVRSRLT
jgi:hypothetical protein